MGLDKPVYVSYLVGWVPRTVNVSAPIMYTNVKMYCYSRMNKIASYFVSILGTSTYINMPGGFDDGVIVQPWVYLCTHKT